MTSDPASDPASDRPAEPAEPPVTVEDVQRAMAVNSVDHWTRTPGDRDETDTVETGAGQVLHLDDDGEPVMADRELAHTPVAHAAAEGGLVAAEPGTDRTGRSDGVRQDESSTTEDALVGACQESSGDDEPGDPGGEVVDPGDEPSYGGRGD